MTTRRPDPDHCVNGHDLRICGFVVEGERKRCRACHRARCRRSSKKRNIMDRPFRVGDKPSIPASGDDG